jgi:hypothetical protein
MFRNYKFERRNIELNIFKYIIIRGALCIYEFYSTLCMWTYYVILHILTLLCNST